MAQIHVLDRMIVADEKLDMCKKLCAETTTIHRFTSESYRTTVQRSTENFCSPTDIYKGCIIYTQNFHISSNFD